MRKQPKLPSDIDVSTGQHVRWGTMGRELREAAQQLAKKGVPPPYFRGYLNSEQSVVCYVGLHQGIPHMYDHNFTPVMRLDLDQTTNIKGPFTRVTPDEAARIGNREAIDKAARPDTTQPASPNNQATETLSPENARQVLRVLQMSRNVTDTPLPLYTTNDHTGSRCVIGLDGNNICIFKTRISPAAEGSNRARSVEIYPEVYLGDAELEMYQNPWQRFNQAEHTEYTLTEVVKKQQRQPVRDGVEATVGDVAPIQPPSPAGAIIEAPAAAREVSPLLSHLLTCIRIVNQIKNMTLCCPFIKAIGPHQIGAVIGIRKLINKRAELVLMEKNTSTVIRPLQQAELDQYEMIELLPQDSIPLATQNAWRMLHDLSSIKVLES